MALLVILPKVAALLSDNPGFPYRTELVTLNAAMLNISFSLSEIANVRESVALFHVHAGAISGPIVFPISSPEHTKSQSMEARIEEVLWGTLAHPGHAEKDSADKSVPTSIRPTTTLQRMEHRVEVEAGVAERARRAVERMLAVGRGDKR